VEVKIYALLILVLDLGDLPASRSGHTYSCRMSLRYSLDKRPMDVRT